MEASAVTFTYSRVFRCSCFLENNYKNKFLKNKFTNNNLLSIIVIFLNNYGEVFSHRNIFVSTFYVLFEKERNYSLSVPYSNELKKNQLIIKTISVTIKGNQF